MTPQSLPSLRLVKTRDAARIVRQSESQLNKLRVYGGGPVFVKLGARIFYEISALEAWVAEHRRSSVSQAA